MTSLSRRALMGASVAAMLIAGTQPAWAVPTTVTYTVAYTGADFTAYTTATAAGSIGSDFTASSTGNITLTGATSTTIPLALTETKDFIGHPITVSGVTGSYLITAYNNTTKVATISARAGYPATFATTPGTGVAYTIADVAVVITIGQSASGSNLWNQGGSAWNFTGLTMDATHTLTINGNTAWNPQVALRPNYLGDPAQPVIISTANAHVITLNQSGTGSLLFFNNIQFQCNAGGNGYFAIMDQTFGFTLRVTATNVLFQNINSVSLSNTVYCAIGTFTNCIIASDQASTGMIVSATGGTFLNCAFYGYSETGTTQTPATSKVSSSAGTFTGCWFFACTALSGGGGAATYSKCYSELSGTGITTVTAINQFVLQNGQRYSDIRPLSTSALGGQSGAPPSATDIYGVTRSSGNWTAGPVEALSTLPATQAVTYSVANSGGDLTNLTGVNVLNNVTGTDLTYFQSGQTCSGTAADNHHIVLAAPARADCIGHPIQWSGVTCMITGLIGNIASVSTIAGYPANFGGTPQSGDAYTIFPTQVTFNIGLPASGNIWQLNQGILTNSGGLLITGMSSPINYVRLTSSSTFSSSTAVGDITLQAVPCIANSIDHCGVFGPGTPYFYIDHLQIGVGIPGGSTQVALDGVFMMVSGATGTPGVPPFLVQATKCMIRNDSVTTDAAHQAFVEDSSLFPHGLVFDTCVMVNTIWQATDQNLLADYLDCTMVCTDNLILTATSTVTSGNTTITVNSTTGIAANFLVNTFSLWPSHPAIPAGTSVTVVNATTLTLGAATIGTITNGDPIYFNSGRMIQWSRGVAGTVQNTIICGAFIPIQVEGGQSGLPTVTTCATEVAFMGASSPGSQTTNLTATGFIQVSYPALFNSASGLGFRVLPDMRLAAGASVLAGQGTHRASNPTDFFEVARANPPTIGAIEYVAAATPGRANFFHASPF